RTDGVGHAEAEDVRDREHGRDAGELRDLRRAGAVSRLHQSLPVSAAPLRQPAALSGAAPLLLRDETLERERVVDSVRGVVVVEVDVNRLHRATPFADAIGPCGELRVAVAAVVLELRRSM